MHTDIREVAERRRQAVGHARVERGAAAARGVDRRLHLRVDFAAVHDPGALRARDRSAERPVADVRDEARSGRRDPRRARAGAPAPAASRARGSVRGLAHVSEHTGARSPRARVGPRAALYARIRCQRETQSIDPGDRRRLAAPLDAAARPAVPPVPWRKLALGVGLGLPSVGGALAMMIPRINDEQGRARRRGARGAGAQRGRQPRPHHRARSARAGAAAALLPAAGASPTERERRPRRPARTAWRPPSSPTRRRARRRGELRPVKGPTTCERAPARPPTPRRVRLLHRSRRDIPKARRNLPGALGYPFRAVVDYDDFSYTWCKRRAGPGRDARAGTRARSCSSRAACRGA